MNTKEFVETHIIDIDDLLQKEYEKESRYVRIHKFHCNVRDRDRKDYEPIYLSIGPYHHGNPSLRKMEEVKWRYLNYFLELNQEKSLQDYIEAVNKIEKHARNMYADEIQLDRKSFVEMLLLDACFILMTLNGTDGILEDFEMSISMDGRGVLMDEKKDHLVVDIDVNNESIQENKCHVNVDEDNSYQNNDMITKSFWRDVLLFENQIPFFVITKVYEIATSGRYPISSLLKNVVQSMKDLFGYHPEEIKKYEPPKEIYHLLHLFHMYFKPSQSKKENCQNHLMRPTLLNFGGKFFKQNNPWATQLQPPIHWRPSSYYHEARIGLRKKKLCDHNPHSRLDIRFNNGTLEIPFLTIEPDLLTLLMNLIAFEQLCPQFGKYFTSYAIFWSQFITTTDDVVLLIDKGIIRHVLGSDNEVVHLLKSLNNAVVFDLNDDNYLKSLCHIMEAYYQVHKPPWKEWLDLVKSKVSNLRA